MDYGNGKLRVSFAILPHSGDTTVTCVAAGFLDAGISIFDADRDFQRETPIERSGESTGRL